MTSEEATMTGIVVGVDRSPASLAGFRWAADEAARRGTSLLILHVVPARLDNVRSTDPVFGGYTAEQLEREHRELVAWLALELDGRAFVDVGIAVRVGDPVAELVTAGNEADLLVVTAHDGPVHRLLLGSVCRAVLDRASCPVAVVHPHRAPRRGAAA
jgi:nucleotide-binding universal stress UspA family protein